MSEFYKLVESLELFDLFEKIQNNIFYITEIQKFDLKIPTCLQNEQHILNFYLMEKWLDDFPKQSLVFKFIQERKKLFYLPESSDFYYLYYHLLIACKNYLETGKEIFDDKTQINYYELNDELIAKKLNATRFFEIYLEKGSNFTDEDLFLAKKTRDELNDKENETETNSEKTEIIEMISKIDKFSPSGETELHELALLEESELKQKKEEKSQIKIEVEEVNLDEEVNFKSFV